jgi:O-acetylhomoserine (thiol)-lyase
MSKQFDDSRVLSPRRNSTNATNVEELISEQLDHFNIDENSDYGKAMALAANDIYNAQHNVMNLWEVYNGITAGLDKTDDIAYFNAKRFLSFQIAKVLDTLQNPFRKSHQNLNHSDQTTTAKGPYPIIDNVTALFSANPVITRTATYVFACNEWIDDAFKGKEFLHEIYSRLLNPTSVSLANQIVDLEAGPYTGEYMAWNYNSGMAAIDGLLSHMLTKDDIIIVSRSVYGGTYQLLHDWYSKEDKMNITVEWFDGHSGEEFESFLTQVLKNNSGIIESGSKVHVYIESPSNPDGYVLDVPEISKISHAKGIKVSLDATVATPFLYKPLQRENKAERPDYVVHSLTKDIAGHGNVIAGCVIGENHNMFTPKGMTVNGVSWENSMFWSVYYIKGAFLSSDGSFEVLTGMKTLHQRMLQKTINTAIIAKVFSANKYVNVNCNIVKGHKNEAIRKKLLKYDLPAPLFTVDFEGVDIKKETFRKFFDSLAPMFNMHISLGQTNTTITCPALTTHSEMDADALKATGLYFTTMRMGVGDENPKELISHFIACAERSIKNELPDFVAEFPSQEEVDEMVTSEYLKYHKNYITSL